jgi:hypothetical protein
MEARARLLTPVLALLGGTAAVVIHQYVVLTAFMGHAQNQISALAKMAGKVPIAIPQDATI